MNSLQLEKSMHAATATGSHLTCWGVARALLGYVAMFYLSGPMVQAAPPVESAEGLVWHQKENRVEAQLTGWSLGQFLEQLALATDWEIYVEPKTERTIWTKFKNLTQSEALARVLGDLNYALLPQSNAPSKLFVFRTSVHEATSLVKSPTKKATAAGAKDRIPNELIVTLKPGSKEKIESLAARLGAKVVGRIDGLNAYRLRFDNEEAADGARTALEASPDISSIDSNYNIQQPTITQPLAASSAPPLNLRPNTAPDPNRLVVGLIDTGVQGQAGKIQDFLLPGISVASDTVVAQDAPTHGTSMAETILRSMSTIPQGADGVSTRILPVDVYGGSENTSTFDVANGIYSAVKGGATLVNLSLGSSSDSPFLHQIIEQAHQQGVVFVAAAGNEPTTAPTYPAAYPEVLAATAGDRQGNLAPYANRGSFVDFVAPGSSIVYFDNQAYLVSGTSTSTAYITGLAAGLAATSGKPVSQVEADLRKQLGIKVFKP